MIGHVGNPSFLPVSGTSIVGGRVANGTITSSGLTVLSLLSLLSFCLGVEGLRSRFFCGGGAVNGLAFFSSTTTKFTMYWCI